MDGLEKAAQEIISGSTENLKDNLTILSDDLTKKNPKILKNRELVKDLLVASMNLLDNKFSDDIEALIDDITLFLCSDTSNEMNVWIREIVFHHIFKVLDELPDEEGILKYLNLFSELIQYNPHYSVIACDLGIYNILDKIIDMFEEKEEIDNDGEMIMNCLECIVDDLLSDDASSHEKFIQSEMSKRLIERLGKSKGVMLILTIGILNSLLDNVCDEYVKIFVEQGLYDTILKLINNHVELLLEIESRRNTNDDKGSEESESIEEDEVEESLQTLIETFYGLMKYDREYNSKGMINAFLANGGNELVNKIKQISDDDIQEAIEKFEKVFIKGEEESEEEEEEFEEDDDNDDDYNLKERDDKSESKDSGNEDKEEDNDDLYW